MTHWRYVYANESVKVTEIAPANLRQSQPYFTTNYFFLLRPGLLLRNEKLKKNATVCGIIRKNTW